MPKKTPTPNPNRTERQIRKDYNLDKPDDQLTLSDVMQIWGCTRYVDGKIDGFTRQYSFPLVCCCQGCGSPSALYTNRAIKRPDLAYEVSLLQYGQAMAGWDNPPPTKCRCEERVKVLKEELKNLPPIESDTGWSGWSGGRCIVDYGRTVKFSAPVDPDMMEKYIELIGRTDRPAGQYFNGRQADDRTVGFSATCDSSD
jgi:hypothetical protein